MASNLGFRLRHDFQLAAATPLNVPLDVSSDMARYRVGKQELNRYLYERFAEFKPGTSQLALVQLPWDSIYTTNYDTLVEDAASNGSITPAGVIKPIFSKTTELEQFEESDIVYYKLHGCINHANSDEGRLILTKEDYRYYETYRKPLFKRLRSDVTSKTILFIGYSFNDPNFIGILDDCKAELGYKGLPRSYAVRPRFSEIEQQFWLEKYNIQFIDSSGDEFLELLKETWISQGRRVTTFEDRESRIYYQVDRATRLPKIAESYYQVRTSDCVGELCPDRFFHGEEPTWAEIAKKVAPPRDAYWRIFDSLIPELTNPSSAPSRIYMVTGAAGTGKTTLIYTLAYDLADYNVDVLIHIPNTPLDTKFLAEYAREKGSRRIVLVVRHAADFIRDLENFISEARQRSIPVTILLEERKNQWLSASDRFKYTPTAEFELGSLSLLEVNNILDALAKHNALGKLSGLERQVQVDHFTALADKELLVALRELTSERNFDAIIKDEFNKIPSQKAKLAYVYVAALGQMDLAVRYETIVRLLDLQFAELRDEVLLPTTGVLLTGELSGNSRHNVSYRIRARHPIIASIIFDSEADTDQKKYDILNNFITHLDPGFNEDDRMLREIIRKKRLVHSLSSYDMRRAIYEKFQAIFPDDPYVYQHRSILERDMDNAEASVDYARLAVKLQPRDPAFENTLGMALEYSARKTQDPFKRDALLREATLLFESNIKRDGTNPFGYLGKSYVIRQQVEIEREPAARLLLEEELLSLLEEGYEATSESSVIAAALAEHQGRVGDPNVAIEILQAGLDKKPNDTRLRSQLIRFEERRGNPQLALRLALDGVKYDPTSWYLHRHIARAQRKLGESNQAVRSNYEAAVRYQQGNLGLLVEFGAFLFTNSLFSDAKDVFVQARSLQVPSSMKWSVREWWKSKDGKKTVFKGKISSINGAGAYVLALPENFEVYIDRSKDASIFALRKGDEVRFQVGFNAFGPIGNILK